MIPSIIQFSSDGQQDWNVVLKATRPEDKLVIPPSRPQEPSTLREACDDDGGGDKPDLVDDSIRASLSECAIGDEDDDDEEYLEESGDTPVAGNEQSLMVREPELAYVTQERPPMEPPMPDPEVLKLIPHNEEDDILTQFRTAVADPSLEVATVSYFLEQCRRDVQAAAAMYLEESLDM
ncbi:expressed unknown protein [Seminavis robusta]|uniref:Uncharacterized protein n=1 Tax=Seminavis robusta TaxID=568900 RepID=A0A9N8D8Q7_9STRA|nr:expressed unknown protein [Seminavis robusta]|eukprot:Sro33_g021250.1 n/a (179) ;mRNA; f:26050-26586